MGINAVEGDNVQYSAQYIAQSLVPGERGENSCTPKVLYVVFACAQKLPHARGSDVV